MKISGEKLLNAPQDRIWSALNDPEVLRKCIPGCESFDVLEGNRYQATVVSKIGPVQARFQGKVSLSDINPPHGYTISGEGTGGNAGNAKGTARVRLEPAQGGTKLSWEADAQVTGKLAQIGSRLIDSAANMMANQFFDRFQQIIAGEEPLEQPIRVVPLWIWVGSAAVILIALAVYLLV